MGETKIYASVSGPHEMERHSEALMDEAVLRVNLCVAPFGGGVDRIKQLSRGGDKTNQKMAGNIKAIFEGAVFLDLHPRSQIDLNIVVLADDGGRLVAAVNAATLALVDAGIAMRDFVVGCEAGYLNNGTLIDLSSSEKQHYATLGDAVVLPVVMMPQRDKVMLCQSDSRHGLEVFEETLEAGVEGCGQVFRQLQTAVRAHAVEKQSLPGPNLG